MQSFEQVMKERHSVRAFDAARPVPVETLRQVLELAQLSPSNCNAQPWRVFIAAGQRCQQLRQRLVQAAAAGQAPEEVTTPAFVGRYRELQVACAVRLFDKLQIERRDTAGRARAALRNFEFFDAPQVAILCMDATFGVGVALDVGAYLQSLLLALQAHGISSCAQASLRSYASIVRAELGIADSLSVLVGVSFGYPLPGAPVNQVRQARSPLEDNVTLLGF